MPVLKIATIDDLVRVLDEHPQWLDELRRRLLPREVLDLPRQLADFAAATDRRFKAVEERLGVVEERLGVVEDRLGVVEDRLGVVEDRVGGLEDRVGGLQGQVGGLQGQVAEQGRQLNQLRDDVGPLKAAHVSNAARRLAYRMAEEQGLELVEILEWKDLGAMVRASDTHGISEDDLESFRVADMVLRATDPDGAECYVAVEVSYTVNGRDTRRAIRNAEFLTRFTGRRADAVVAGLRRDNRICDAVKSGAVVWFKLPRQAVEVD